MTTTAASAATSGALTVVMLSRNGVAVTGTIAVDGIGTTNTRRYTLTSGTAQTIANGTYAVLADIAPAGDVTDTLAAQVVTISGAAKTVTLDARQGKPFTVSLDTAPGSAYVQNLEVAVCAADRSYNAVRARGTAGGLYVIPNSSSYLNLGYESAWQHPATNDDAYVVSGLLSSVGSTAPVVKRSSMATVNAQMRTGPTGSPDVDLALQAEDIKSNIPRCDSGLDQQVAYGTAPYQQTVHVSPGAWNIVSKESGPDNAGQTQSIGSWTAIKTLTAGQTYAAAFYHAAWGPRRQLPYTNSFDGTVAFDTSEMIEDPGTYGSEVSVMSTSTLSLSGTVLSTQTNTPYTVGHDAVFAYKITKAGWYTLTVNATRYRPGWTWPAGLNSPKTSAKFVWYQTLGTYAVAPVFLSRFNVAGLDRYNHGQPGATQQVPIIIERTAQGNGTLTPDTVKDIKAYASYDHGVTWHAVTVTRTSTSITAAVPNPASGTVSLRASVNDPKGNYSTITVYDAYTIA